MSSRVVSAVFMCRLVYACWSPHGRLWKCPMLWMNLNRCLNAFRLVCRTLIDLTALLSCFSSHFLWTTNAGDVMM